jgi:FlaA1/EpsC-like NDP-sugar epimerase
MIRTHQPEQAVFRPGHMRAVTAPSARHSEDSFCRTTRGAGLAYRKPPSVNRSSTMTTHKVALITGASGGIGAGLVAARKHDLQRS